MGTYRVTSAVLRHEGTLYREGRELELTGDAEKRFVSLNAVVAVDDSEESDDSAGTDAAPVQNPPAEPVDYSALDYPALQEAAKAAGIASNQSKDALVEALSKGAPS